ncbi:MAG: right-handed parallel beta-helix repeat-containing protein, partial [Myxococcales bacterium]|nr:right-handed parallel beta-helix repeat-containing protein [Myxococcales bacterium]
AGGAAAGGAAAGGAAAGGAAAGGSGSTCAAPPAFDVGVTYATTLYVATTGTTSGTGTMANPFDTIARAVAAATPGTRILVGPGTYPSVSLGSLTGTPTQPIALVANGAVTINGAGGVGVSMSDGQYVVIEGFTIANSSVHGMNLDDGSSLNTPSHHVVLRRLTIPSAGSGGNNDCIKLSGLDDFWVLDSDVAGCNLGEAIDMVGCHRGVISGNTFHDVVGSGVQAKGGSEDVLIHRNRFERIPGRSVNAGGSTGLAFFRPQNATAEARNIRVLSNLFLRSGTSSGAAVAFVGCDGCVAAHNTIIEPSRWVVRILQENTDARFVPSRNGLFVNNLIVLNAASISTIVNVGSNTSPNTFTFGNNLWFALDQGAGWTPPIVGVPAEMGSIVQRDPLLVNRAQGDYRLMPTSPAGGAARTMTPRLSDFSGTCYATPASIGAFER